MIAAYSGLRLGEIMRLEPGSVRDGCLYVATGKSGKPRVVPIGNYILNSLTEG